jgi:hypothetical protein
VEAFRQVESELSARGAFLVRYSGTQKCDGSCGRADPRAHGSVLTSDRSGVKETAR